MGDPTQSSLLAQVISGGNLSAEEAQWAFNQIIFSYLVTTELAFDELLEETVLLHPALK